jgi:hypothetical protein
MPEERKNDTPETDAATMELHGKRLATGGWWVEADFARKLERERDAYRAALQEIMDIDETYYAFDQIRAVAHNALNGHE